MIRSPLLVSVALFVPLCLPAIAGAGEPQDVAVPESEPDPILGGTMATTCGWPTAVSTAGGGCSGTLVHPRVVVYAAHCGAGQSPIRFGEIAGAGASAPVDFCRTYPSYGGVSDVDHDWAFCVLQSPVPMPVTPPLYGCELDDLKIGAPVTIAGFGAPSNGRKFWADTYINNVEPGNVNIGGNGVAACPGDSGGPAYIEMDDGTWRAFGIVSTGSDCGRAVNYSRIDQAVPWIEMESGVDITPCFDVDGTWNPGPDCKGFIASAENGTGNWGNWCQGTPGGDFSSTCGDPFNQDPDDTAPTVTITAPMDGEEFADAPQTLTVSIDADDGDGWGIKEVRLEIDGGDVGLALTMAPYDFAGVEFPAGVYELVGVAEDLAGNVGMSDPVTIGVGQDLPDPGDGETGDGDTGGTGTGGDDGMDDDGSSDDGGTGGADGSASDDSKGCACAAGGPASVLPLLGLPLLLLRRRRR